LKNKNERERGHLTTFQSHKKLILMLMGLFGKVKFHEKWFETFILQQKNIEG
jgi:hypothetical protein